MKTRFYTLIVLIFSLCHVQAQESRLQLGFEPKQDEESVQLVQAMPLATQRNYVENSVLASGKFVKIKVAQSGICRINYETLKAQGIDPANARVFGYGGAVMDQDLNFAPEDDLPEVAVYFEKGNDGVFGAGDYLLFYAQGPQKWHYNASNSSFYHTLNHYSTDAYYFITSDAGVGKQVLESNLPALPESAATYLIEEFNDFQVHEKELLNLGRTGKVFYGEEFNITPLSYNLNFEFPNIVASSITTLLDVAVSSGSASNFTLKLNELPPVIINVSAKNSEQYVIGYEARSRSTFANPKNDQLSFTLSFNKGNKEQKAYLNFLEVNARRQLIMTGDVMYFRNSDHYGKNAYNRFRLKATDTNIQIWDITDPLNIRKVSTTRDGEYLEFVDPAEKLREYVALNPSKKSAFQLEPTVVGNVANQNIHGMPSAEFVILTHPMFLSQAERLAQAHRDIDGLTVNVITTEQVYNEFSSGTPDATAYRLAMKMWFDRNELKKPKYLLLFGRGSYDNRGIFRNSGDNLVLTYQADNSLDKIKSYVTDDYFGFLADGKGVNLSSDVLDLGIGRFPVATLKQAEDVVNKNITYMLNKNRSNWKNQFAFVADDGDGGMHMRDMENKVVKPLKSLSPGYQFQKIYLDAFKKEITANGESYPLVRNQLLTLINSGVFMLNFMGHAGEHGWTTERVLTSKDVKDMYNDCLPLWMAATCDFVLFDVETVSAGEHVLLNPNGGGIGLFSAARVVYASENARLNEKFVLRLFSKNGNGGYPRMGDAVRQSKNDVGSGMNKLSYMLFGNPALRLNYPTELQVQTELINGETIQGDEVLKALSVNRFKAFISDDNGVKISDFNGVVEITIQDKVQQITTLNNQDKGSITYEDRPNMLYAGKANVVNGEFEFTVMIPRDIRYNYGTGRINYYASEENGREAQGYYENFIVGGIMDVDVDDEEGPEVQMYLNEPGFVSGGKVNETPMFIAHITDENGINTAGSGIGHDLKLVIDENPISTYVLNGYFDADAGSYKRGTVRMKLPELSAGKHTLSFYVWDLLNNSSLKTLEFEVVPGLEPQVFSVSNYPNPVKTNTTFVVAHDRPQMILETKLEIFDLAGKKIYEKEQSNADNLTWNLEAGGGNRVQAGVYLYRISINTQNGKITSKANKIMVLGQ